MKNSNIRDLTIIGSGPAGLSAAIYASRANLEPLVIEGKEPGGQLMSTSYIENWPGVEKIRGPELMSNLKQHAKSFGTQFLPQSVVSVDLLHKPFLINTDNNIQIQSKAIIISTGANPKRLGCKGENEYWSKGVSSCAICDGALFRNKNIIIVGGGDSAMENASFMTNFTDKITIVHILPELTASYSMQKKIITDPKIKIIYNSSVSEIKGNDHQVSSVSIFNYHTQTTSELETDAVFIAIGLIPNTKIFKDQLELTEYGHIVLKNNTETSVKGIFAAGDVADAKYRQAITSAGSGCAASLDAERYLKNLED